MTTPSIKDLFEHGARFYDRTNSLLSLGLDEWWRKQVARSIKGKEAGVVADIATGTAKVAVQIARIHPEMKVIGVDFSPQMIAIGVKRVKKQHLDTRTLLVIGDGRALPLPRHTCDALTIVFGIRNIPERETALQEFYGALKSGGQLIIMEFGFPQNILLRVLYRFYFDRIFPSLGNFFVRLDNAYTYLRDSVYRFPSPKEFMASIQAAGFAQVEMRQFTGGIVNMFLAVKH